MARVTKDTTIGEVIQIDAGVIPILMGAGSALCWMSFISRRDIRRSCYGTRY